jgi:hypothetical protein
MKYMLLIYHDEQAFTGLTEDERQAMYKAYRDLREELTTTSKFITGSQLQPASTASSVRVRNGRAITTDGPFAETKEQLGGYFLIDVETAAEANAVAARIPSAEKGTVEVRALV